MKPRSKVEEFVADTGLNTHVGKDRQILRDLLQVHQDFQHGQSPLWRTIMRQKSFRIAAVVALTAILIGAFSLGTGSVALSQTRHAVNATLAWLKSMIVGGEAPAPQVSSVLAGARVVTCAARFFRVTAADQGLWQSLKDQGIELVAVSADPPVSYATLSREQAEAIDGSLTLTCFSAPRVTVFEGNMATLAVTNAQPSGGLALAWLPTVSSDGREVQSTIAFHDGNTGFEIPNAGAESGGAVLIRTKGVFPSLTQGNNGPEEVLIRLRMDLQ